MAERFASWLPGYSVIGQDPDVERAIERVGGSAAYSFAEGEEARWFHFPLATPVLVQGKRATFARVMLLFKSDPNFGPTVDRVDVWDGGNGIGRKDGMELAGDYSNTIVDGENIVDVNHDGVQWGVGVSVHVYWTGPGHGQIRFVSAGGDFDFDL